VSNNTPNYWSVSDPANPATHKSLNTFANSIDTLGGDALGVANFRGANQTIPHAPGERWMPKVADARVLTLGMWVNGAEPDGSVPSDPRALFNRNYRNLRRLLWRPRGEFTLRKRFRDENNIFRTADAQAEYASGLNPSMNGPARATFVVDLRLADPFFYEQVNPVNLVAGRQNIVNAGDAPSQRINVRANAVRGKFTIFNHTTGAGFTFNDTVGAGYVDFNVKAYTAKNNSGINMVGSVTHSGASAWLELDPGVNDIELIATGGGSGAVTLTYWNAWL
jgi:hypothetical protein